MNKSGKASKSLIAFTCVVWTALVCVCAYAVVILTKPSNPTEASVARIEQKLKAEQQAQNVTCKVQPQQPLINSAAAYKDYQSALLTQSISICKNDYAEDIACAVMREHRRQGIPVYVAYSLIGSESDQTRTNNVTEENCGYFNPQAKSRANCRGLTQICHDTLNDFNTFNKFGHYYTWADMFDIDKNIEVGVWHYLRYSSYVGKDYTILYIVYNVGYNKYKATNNYWIYNNYSQKWEQHSNGWYYRNGKYPPEDVNLSFKELETYNPVSRFTKYLKLYQKSFAL